MKICSKCKCEKMKIEFHSNKRNKDGLSYICIKCQNEYVKKHYYKNKQQYLNKNKERKNKAKHYVIQKKKEGKCVVCGENRWWVLDFHHTESKTDAVSKMLGWGLERIKIEVAKCVLLCANCHRNIHYKNNTPIA